MTNSNEFQVQAFVKEFPALFVWPESRVYAERHVPLVREDVVQEVRVSRISPELMDARPHDESFSSSLADTHDRRLYFLLGEEMNLLGEVRPDVCHEDAGRHDGRSEERGETVGESIARLGVEDRIAYILYREDNAPYQGERTYCATLYKPPKGFSVVAWVKEQRRRAEGTLAAQVDVIDAEGGR